ncbi:hypothetical protein B0H15DRAFT_763604, partial [Mycena belliarum]
DVEPIEMLWQTIALCTRSDEKPVALLTDINARTGSSQIQSQLDEFVRSSSDPEEKTNTRGRAVLQECDTYGLIILNGTSFETASPGRLTSWQPGGNSVIDYALVSKPLLPRIRKFHVTSPTPD